MAGERAEDFSSTGSWHDTKPQTWKGSEKPIFSVSGDSSAGPHPCEHHNPGFNRRTERGCGGRAAARPLPERLPSARVAALARPAHTLPPRSPARAPFPGSAGPASAAGAHSRRSGRTPRSSQGPGLCRPRNARRAAGDGQAAAVVRRARSGRAALGSPPARLPPPKVPFGAVAQKAEAQPLGRSSPHVAASKLPFLD